MNNKLSEMRKLLKTLRIIQQKDDDTNKSRLNPYNPLSYITLVLIFIVGIFMFGFIGFWNEVDSTNPFKWR